MENMKLAHKLLLGIYIFLMGISLNSCAQLLERNSKIANDSKCELGVRTGVCDSLAGGFLLG